MFMGGGGANINMDVANNDNVFIFGEFVGGDFKGVDASDVTRCELWVYFENFEKHFLFITRN
jgi:hypothetical protein